MYSTVALTLLAFGVINVQVSSADEFSGCTNKNLYLCTQCNTNCTACTMCQEGWRLNPLNDGSYGCARCHPTCRTCNVNTGVCLTCSDALTGPSTDGTCASCGQNCEGCTKNGAGRCDDKSCKRGYGLDSDNMCTKCSDQNCESCPSDYNVCEICQSGCQRSSLTNSCYPNGTALPTQYQIELTRRLQKGYSSIQECTNLPNCLTCTSDGQLCMSCRPSFGLVLNDTASGCQPCADTCALCSSNVHECTTCNNAGWIKSAGDSGHCQPPSTIQTSNF